MEGLIVAATATPSPRDNPKHRNDGKQSPLTPHKAGRKASNHEAPAVMWGEIDQTTVACKSKAVQAMLQTDAIALTRRTPAQRKSMAGKRQAH